MPWNGSTLHRAIAIENVWNQFLLSPLEMKAFIDSFGRPSIKVGECVDIII